MKFTPDYGATITLLFLLLSVDAAFIGIHILHVWSPWLTSQAFSIETDRGIAEIYQYIKLFWLSLCLILIYLQTRLRVFIGWAVLFAFLLLDDAMQIHERAGFWLGATLNLPEFAGLRPDDCGELLFAALIGCLTLGLAAHALWRGRPSARQASRDLLCLVGLLACFGVGADLLHVIAHFRIPAISAPLALIEDGGEMIVISAMTGYVFDIASNSGKMRINLWLRIEQIWKPVDPAEQPV
ncbi:MAG: hypothetical protein R3E82_06305 [Pseudomonadales bacterium]|nr:hypothetical protein [Pseudomonadales bacterium]